MTTSALPEALQLAGLGAYIFPLRPGDKRPLHKGWQDEATRDPAKIKAWLSAGNNYGIFTGKFGNGEALVVIDVDVKNGKDGRETLAALRKEEELPDTLTHDTPSGGQHMIFRSPQPVKQGVDVLGAGLDIRSDGGYVVGPGS